MAERRDFLRSLAAFAATPGSRRSVGAQHAAPLPTPGVTGGPTDREYWLDVLTRLAQPVLTNLAQGRLRQRMPVETAPAGNPERRDYTHLEAVGRLFTGIAPWLELGGEASPEGELRQRYADLARRGLRAATDPRSPDVLNFARGRQPLVDAAFLAHAIVRAPRELWQQLDGETKHNVVTALKSTRGIRPSLSNWLMFSAIIETALSMMGEEWDRTRVDYALTQHEQWYKGDGVYGDGPSFHWDYYNSFVIHPMLLDVLRLVGTTAPEWQRLIDPVLQRARRYAAIQERMISPEGTFPPIGRSLAYRFGAFQLLAQMALRRQLPEGVTPAQVRCGLTAVIRRMIEAPGTFDAQGWLTIGFCGHQPSIGEGYISTGSAYLCAAGLLPLGLPATDEFWSAAPADWTARKAWGGENVTPDHAI
ncbi:MAG: hypothetical protein DMD69_14820 [Gemmatimonadetes bacterium]|nr:MAG: hypothetical protein DMD69_14820 [Gemmatimonadota bacterium]PYP24422.1 MAG: hypothetical protein DMD55_14450 [Gemmatimonadota bacterium]